MKTVVQFDLLKNLYRFQVSATLEVFENIFGGEAYYMFGKFEYSFKRNSVTFFEWCMQENKELLINYISNIAPRTTTSTLTV